MNDQQHSVIREAVERRMASFEAAERTLDARALLAHFSDAGDFYMYNDGHRLTLEEVAAAVGNSFPALRSIAGGFSGLEVQVLAPDAALATATFQETVTTREGTVVHQWGAASWLWRARGGEWKIVYGHVDHYPGPAGEGEG